MRRLIRVVFFVALILCPVSAVMAENDDIYVVQLPIESRAQSQLNEAIYDGLKYLLVRLCGDIPQIASTMVQAKISRAVDYVKSYRYIQGANGVEQIEMRYASEKVIALLRELRLPAWHPPRLVSLVWLASNQNDRRFYVEEQTIPEIVHSIQLHLERRGLPFIFPLFDVLDRTNLPLSDAWGGYDLSPTHLSRILERYNADGLITGRIEHLSDGRWYCRLNYQYGEQSQPYINIADALSFCIADVVNALADALTAQYSVLHKNELTLVAEVHNILSLSDYTGLIAYLQQIKTVQSLWLKSVSRDIVTLTMQVIDYNVLSQQMLIDRRLVVLPRQANSARFRYRWEGDE